MPVELLVGTRGAEAAHANESALAVKIAIPALADAGLDRDLHGIGAQHLALVIGRLGVEQLEAGHRHHAGRNAVLLQQVAGRGCNADLGTGADRKSTRLNSSHTCASRTPSTACTKQPY